MLVDAQVLKLELKEIREQQDLLFRFMNFLKQEGAVHVLQFCLTVGELYYYSIILIILILRSTKPLSVWNVYGIHQS